jgi:hypothetical protein
MLRRDRLGSFTEGADARIIGASVTGTGGNLNETTPAQQHEDAQDSPRGSHFG